MRNCDKLVGLIVPVMIWATGCGKSPSNVGDTATAQPTNAQENGVAQGSVKLSLEALKSDTPEAAITKFLEAIRTGNDRIAETMFTQLARERIKELDIQVAPRGSDTAKFEVGSTEMLTDDGARVPCKWTDVDKDGHPRTDDMIWMLSKQPEGWRVAGMAAVVLEGEDPLLLDFENPKETLQKLERLREEIAKRTSPQTGDSRQGGNAEEPIRR